MRSVDSQCRAVMSLTCKWIPKVWMVYSGGPMVDNSQKTVGYGFLIAIIH